MHCICTFYLHISDELVNQHEASQVKRRDGEKVSWGRYNTSDQSRLHFQETNSANIKSDPSGNNCSVDQAEIFGGFAVTFIEHRVLTPLNLTVDGFL